MSSAPRPLVDQLALLIERTYAAASGVVPLGRFIVGDAGYHLLRARGTLHRGVGHAGQGARMMVRPVEARGAWAVALYLPDAMVEHLERHDPRGGLDDGNVDDFATLIEEVDHIVTFADIVVRERRDVSLLELEWHAAVTKYLVLGHFIGRLTGRDRLSQADRAFVEHHLFHKGEFSDPEPYVRRRYRDATRLAVRFVRRLGDERPRARVKHLRRFHRASHHQKLRQFA
ncbi:MAG: hypothetical protein OEQ13_02295 [Acidobacteriota bacterium]|nr:hypothetical protein [Acidobacteriota bacterium]